MITRPLDLAARLRPPPRSLDPVFYVNAGLIVLFFSLFGSRFVLSPGLGIDFRLPVMPGAVAGGRPTDVVIAVRSADMVMVEGFVLNLPKLKTWLEQRAEGHHDLRLLVQASAELSLEDMTQIEDMAHSAGFAVVQIAAEPAAAP